MAVEEVKDIVSDGESDEDSNEESDGVPEDEFNAGEESDGDKGDSSDVSDESDNENNSDASCESDQNEDDEMRNDGNEASEEDEEGNAGWADAMAKVLAIGKNSDKTVSVLSKAKKDNVKQKKKVKPKDDSKADGDKDSDDEPVLEPLAVRKARKKELDSIGRTKPDILQKNAEKVLTKIATRGVVQLFNAVRDQQKDMKNKLREAGGSTRKREKVFKNIDKNSFVEILTGTKQKPLATDQPPSKKPKTEVKEEDKYPEEDQASTWDILRDDYMLGAKMRDWDKDSDGD